MENQGRQDIVPRYFIEKGVRRVPIRGVGRPKKYASPYEKVKAYRTSKRLRKVTVEVPESEASEIRSYANLLRMGARFGLSETEEEGFNPTLRIFAERKKVFRIRSEMEQKGRFSNVAAWAVVLQDQPGWIIKMEASSIYPNLAKYITRVMSRICMYALLDDPNRKKIILGIRSK